jgi:hypothetical protein
MRHMKYLLAADGGKTRGRKSFVFKWAQQDSNLRPADYESAALTN